TLNEFAKRASYVKKMEIDVDPETINERDHDHIHPIVHRVDDLSSCIFTFQDISDDIKTVLSYGLLSILENFYKRMLFVQKIQNNTKLWTKILERLPFPTAIFEGEQEILYANPRFADLKLTQEQLERGVSEKHLDLNEK